MTTCNCGRAWEGHPNPHSVSCPMHNHATPPVTDQALYVARSEGASAVHGAVERVLEEFQPAESREVAGLILAVRDAMQLSVSDPGSLCGASMRAWGVNGTCGAPIGHEGAHQ